MSASRKTFWNPLYIGIITYFCLVLPGVILFSKNFEKLGKKTFKTPVAVFGTLYFLALLAGWLLLSQDWDIYLQIAHVGIAIGLAAFQYPYYRKLLDDETEEEEIQVESLLKPGLLSILFALFMISLGISWNWYSHEKLKEEMQIAMQQYDSGDYRKAVDGLQHIIEEYPGESLAYTNLSITYEAMGEQDSAIWITEKWLEIAPGDSSAQDRLYSLRYLRSDR